MLFQKVYMIYKVFMYFRKKVDAFKIKKTQLKVSGRMGMI